jgi:hypothetical protein
MDELKQAAGSPYPYRLAVGAFWWLGGVALLLSVKTDSIPFVAAPFFVGDIFAGGFFYLRMFRRGLGQVILLYLVKPKIGLPLLGWLLFGNPMRESLAGKLIPSR